MRCEPITVDRATPRDEEREPPPTGHILVDGLAMPFWLPPGLTAAMVRVRPVSSSQSTRRPS
jgi:hypothetical protein